MFHVLSRLEINIECCSLVSVSLVYEITSTVIHLLQGHTHSSKTIEYHSLWAKHSKQSLCGLELTIRLGLLVSEPKKPPASASHCWNYKCALHLALYTEAGDRTGPHACWKALYRLSYLSPRPLDEKTLMHQSKVL